MQGGELEEKYPPGSLHIDHMDPHVVDMVQFLLDLGFRACPCKAEYPEVQPAPAARLVHKRECMILNFAAGVVAGLLLKEKGKL